MVVRPDPHPQQTDWVLPPVPSQLLAQRLLDEHVTQVRATATRWADGMKSLLGFTGVVGLIGAPIATTTLTATTRVIVGVGLIAVFATALAALWLTQSAAAGPTRTTPTPDSPAGLRTARLEQADTELRQLNAGKRLAATSLAVLGVTGGLAWINPFPPTTPILQITTTNGVTFCGPELDAPKQHLSVDAAGEGRVDIATRDIDQVDVTVTCPKDSP